MRELRSATMWSLPKELSDDGCHPKPDTYYIMEKQVMERLRVL